MKKNKFRILIVVGQSLMLLYFVGLTFQTLLLHGELIQPWDKQLGSILSSVLIFSFAASVYSVVSLVRSCLKMPRFWQKRGEVTVWNGCAVGLSVFGVSVITSYQAYFFTGLLWYLVFFAGYCLSFFAFRGFYKKRVEADRIEKSMESAEAKLAKFLHLYEQGYLSDQEIEKIKAMLAPQD